MEKDNSASMALPACKTPAEFKAHRLNLKEQSRLQSLQCYLARQERHCHKDFKTSTLKVQNHFMRRMSAQHESPCPSRLPTSSPTLSMKPANQHVSASLRRASEIPPPRGKHFSDQIFPEGSLQDRLRMRRRTYCGPVLSLSDRTQHCDKSSATGDKVHDCQTCHQLAQMIHSHLTDEPVKPQDMTSNSHPADDFLTPEIERDGNPEKDDIPYGDDPRLDNSRQFMAKSAAYSSGEGKQCKGRGVPLITVDDPDSATDGEGDADLKPTAGRVKAAGALNWRRYSKLASIAGGFNRSAHHTTTNNGTSGDDVIKGKKESYDSSKSAQHTSANSNTSCDRVGEKTEMCDAKRNSDCEVLPHSSAQADMADTECSRKHSEVSRLQPLLSRPERKVSLTSPSLASSNSAMMMSSSLAPTNKTIVTSAGTASPNKTSVKSDSLTSPTKTPMASSNLGVPNRFSTRSSRLSLPNEHQTSPAHMTSPNTNDDVSFNDIILQHAKNCPAGERESIRRNSAILDSLLKKSLPVLPMSAKLHNSTTALHNPPQTLNSSDRLSRSRRVSNSAAVSGRSHKVFNSTTEMDSSHKTSNSPASLLDGSRKAANLPTSYQSSCEAPRSLTSLPRSHKTPNSASLLQHPRTTWNPEPVSSPTKAASATGNRPIQGKVLQFLQQQSEFNKKFPVQNHQVKAMDCVRPDLLQLSQGKRLWGEKKKASKEKTKMITEVLDVLGLDLSLFEFDGTT